MTHRNKIVGFVAAVTAATFMVAQSPGQGWKTPPPEIVKILEAQPAPSATLSPNGDVLLLAERPSLPPMSDLSAPMLRLAGYRVNPLTNGRHGPRRTVGLRLLGVNGGLDARIPVPDGAHVVASSWSPDGSRIAYAVDDGSSIALWIADGRTGKGRRVGSPLNAAMGTPFTWAGSRALLCRTIPAARGAEPKAPRTPAGPVIRETRARKAPVRTYQDLLRDSHDEALFDHYMTSQLVRLDVASGEETPLGAPAIFTTVSASPDGLSILVGRIVRPYSHLVTARSFPTVIEVWDAQGRSVQEFVRQPLRDAVPIGGVAEGRRDVAWIATKPARLVWVEALDGGDPKTEVPHRDRIMMRDLRSDAPATEVFRTKDRHRSTEWLAGGARALVSSYDRKRRWTRTWLVDFDAPSEPRVIFDRSIQDAYGDPGRPLTTTTGSGKSVVRSEGGRIWLTGRGSSPEGDRPFLRRLDLATGKTEELWRCSGESYESVVDLLDKGTILTSHETRTSPPNLAARKLAGGDPRFITDFRDPAPALRNVTKRLVKYERNDGLELSATLYLPPGYKEGERLPLVVWAYPREYTSAKDAGQVRGSPWRFTRVGGTSHLFFLLRGYAVMDAASMPIVGDAETANDTFVEQLVANAAAAIDKAVELGVADRKRVGVGGHSYGAFMTANLLAHSDLFAAGIARSGAYNRTLTPFGFQNERRTFWEAPEVYFGMSPFMHAHKLKEPVLLIHGRDDNNSGTFPIQSERFYHALKGQGGTARLCMLPHESHGYRARESVLHVVAEMLEWFDRNVKGDARP